MPDDDAPPGWWQQFVAAQPARTAKLATIRADGSPHVVPVWVDLDGEGEDAVVVMTTGRDSVKGRGLLRDPRVSVCWDDEQPPFAYVTIFATAQLSDDPDEIRHWATRIGGRYMGADRAQEFGARNGEPTELLVRLAPTRVIAKIDVTG